MFSKPTWHVICGWKRLEKTPFWMDKRQFHFWPYSSILWMEKNVRLGKPLLLIGYPLVTLCFILKYPTAVTRVYGHWRQQVMKQAVQFFWMKPADTLVHHSTSADPATFPFRNWKSHKFYHQSFIIGCDYRVLEYTLSMISSFLPLIFLVTFHSTISFRENVTRR